MILFVDDLTARWDNFKKKKPEASKDAAWVTTTEEACIALIQLPNIDEIWLDHDAGCVDQVCVEPLEINNRRFPLTFRAVCCVLVAMQFKGWVFLHSGNPAGRDWMESFLKSGGVMNVTNLGDGWSTGDSVLD